MRIEIRCSNWFKLNLVVKLKSDQYRNRSRCSIFFQNESAALVSYNYHGFFRVFDKKIFFIVGKFNGSDCANFVIVILNHTRNNT